MNTIKYITYSEWEEMIRAVSQKGLACKELRMLKEVYPNSVGSAYYPIMYNQLAKMETFILNESIHNFQNNINKCLEESDLEILRMAFLKFRNNISHVYFFLYISDYPNEIQLKLKKEIEKNVKNFFSIFLKKLNKIESTDYGSFTQDYCYICKKEIINLRKLLEVG